MTEPLPWNAVGRRIAARRADLRLTQAELASTAEVSHRWLSDLETGVDRRYTPRLLAKVETALRWAPGSIDALRAGQEPAEPPSDPNVLGCFTSKDVLVPMPKEVFTGLSPDQIDRVIESGRRAAADVANAVREAIQDAVREAIDAQQQEDHE